MTKAYKAYAKINLLLSVGDTRDDGKHDVITVMNEVSGLYDELTVALNDSGKIEISCSDENVPCDERNLAYKAASAYFKRFDLQNGVKIHIEKNIPTTAGMGGGSSDAASVLTALHEACGKGNLADLASIAASLGSDVPFFVYGERTMFCIGTGEHAASCPTFPKGFVGVFIKSGEKESTGKAYSILDEKYPPHKRISDNLNLEKKLLSSLQERNCEKIFSFMKNDFEAISPNFSDISLSLSAFGAKKVLLCGSGPTVCAIFDDTEKAKNCAKALGGNMWEI